MNYNKYNEGKIYILKCKNDDSLKYVGSTVNTLTNRYNSHKADSKKPKNANNLFYKTINGDWDNWTIELYENYKCECKKDLQRREGEVTKLLINTLNTKIEGRTNKEYYQDKRESVLKQKKEYYNKNRNHILEQKKSYYDANKKVISIKNKARYIYNKHLNNHYSTYEVDDTPQQLAT